MNSFMPFERQVPRYVRMSAKYDAYSTLSNCPEILDFVLENLSDRSLRLFVVGMSKSLIHSK